MQIDGSEHRWFEDRGPPCTLLVFIDDATGKLMQLCFVRSENAFSYFAALELYLQDHGAPVAFYSAKHSVFRVAKKDAKGGQGMTQFGRARALRAKHRDSLRKFKPGQGPRRAHEPDIAGPIDQGYAIGRDLRHAGGQCVSADVHGRLQRAVCGCPCPI
ncbi:hypothetical protein HNR29_006566 [Rhizobium leguminosarum]|nr:hypothetical protein [Rhizobium leguminosarum]